MSFWVDDADEVMYVDLESKPVSLFDLLNYIRREFCMCWNEYKSMVDRVLDVTNIYKAIAIINEYILYPIKLV